MELLERETYLAALNAALAEAASGAGRVALVSSEAAIGKTSLVERFTQGQRGNATTWHERSVVSSRAHAGADDASSLPPKT